MNPNHLIRRVLSWIRFGRSPKQATERLNGSTAYVTRRPAEDMPTPVELDADDATVVDAADPDRFEATRRIDPAAQRAVPARPDGAFPPRPAAPRSHRARWTGAARVKEPRRIEQDDRNERRWH